MGRPCALLARCKVQFQREIGIKMVFSRPDILTIQLAVSTIRGGKMTVRLKCRKLRLNWFFVLVN